MNILKRIYKELTSLHWEIGFLDNSYESIVRGDALKLKLVTHDYPDSWFADPFILDVSDDEIVVFVEEVTKKCKKGTIAKLVIDRKTLHVTSKKTILERTGHLSFPVIVRHKGSIYVYPENSEDGSLNLYKYNPDDDSMTLVHELCDRPLTDAIITDYFGKLKLFTTDIDAPNGYKLDQYDWNEASRKFEYSTSVLFEEHIARMAGKFFVVDGKLYRPAQESNTNYGHGMSIQETTFENGKWFFKEVRRIVSPHPILTQSCHTLNSYKDVMVVDVLGKRYPKVDCVITKMVLIIKKLLKR